MFVIYYIHKAQSINIQSIYQIIQDTQLQIRKLRRTSELKVYIPQNTQKYL